MWIAYHESRRILLALARSQARFGTDKKLSSDEELSFNEDESDADAVWFAKSKEGNRQGLLAMARNQGRYGTDEEQFPREDESDSDLFSNKKKKHNYLSSGKDGVSKEEDGDIRVFFIPKLLFIPRDITA